MSDSTITTVETTVEAVAAVVSPELSAFLSAAVPLINLAIGGVQAAILAWGVISPVLSSSSPPTTAQWQALATGLAQTHSAAQGTTS